MSADLASLTPRWPAPPGVRAAFTLRGGGVSAAPFDSLNLGTHVGDAAAAVVENRQRVRRSLSLPAEPRWLEQVHGAEVIEVRGDACDSAPIADGIVSREAGVVAAVQVADCLPVLFAAHDASVVAAAHAGWRGLAAGVLEATVARTGVAPARLLAWLGPAIARAHFEVGAEVREAFVARAARAAAAFIPNSRGRWQCDLHMLARQRLEAVGVASVFGGEWCTFADPGRFFSYRRDGRCGRMAALIWRE